MAKLNWQAVSFLFPTLWRWQSRMLTVCWLVSKCLFSIAWWLVWNYFAYFFKCKKVAIWYEVAIYFLMITLNDKGEMLANWWPEPHHDCVGNSRSKCHVIIPEDILKHEYLLELTPRSDYRIWCALKSNGWFLEYFGGSVNLEKFLCSPCLFVQG